MSTVKLFNSECTFVNATYYDDGDIKAMILKLAMLVREIAGVEDLETPVNEITVSYCSGEYKSRVDTLAEEDTDQSLNIFIARKQTMFSSDLEQLSGLGVSDSQIPEKIANLLAQQTLETLVLVVNQPGYGMHQRMYDLVNSSTDRKRYFSFPRSIADELIASRVGSIKIGIHSRAKPGATKEGKLISARRRITRIEHRLFINRMDQTRLTESLQALTEDIEKREERLVKLKATVAALTGAEDKDDNE